MKKSILKDSIREIKNTYKRFLSILLIVLLGVGFYCGMQATSPDMKQTVDTYFDNQNVMDIEVISTLGITEQDIKALEEIEGVSSVCPSYSFDAIVETEEQEVVVKVNTFSENINKLVLVQGNLPKNADECVVEAGFIEGTGYKLGDYITLKPEKMDESILNTSENDNEDTEKPVKNDKLKVVGIVESPEYISRERGASKLGSGKINYYMYISPENMNMSVYTIAYITVENALELHTYSSSYEDLISEVKDRIEGISEIRKQVRYDEIVNEATEKLNDAQSEYDEQKKKAEDEISDGERKISDAKYEITKGERELDYNKRKAQTEFKKANEQIENAQNQLNEAKETLNNKKKEAQEQIDNAQIQLENLRTVKEQYEQLIKQKTELEQQIVSIKQNIELLNKDQIKNEEQIQKLKETEKILEESLNKINYGIQQIEQNLLKQGIKIENLNQTISTIEIQIKNAKQELTNAEQQISNAEIEIEENKKKLEETKKTTNNQLAKAQKELNTAKEQIEENETKLKEAKQEAEEKLQEAQEKLNDARIQISKIERPTWYILDRNSNYGYAEYTQDADRIGNIAKVFPVVFFVVAALISLTSMSRMIEEQRVQIGTLKALGYNKVEISVKYILYAFFATVIGSLIGMSIGFRLLPDIVCSMYAMMYVLPEADFVFRGNIAIIGIIVALICTIGATIYTCAKELKEQPARLMLPRAPKPGKRILLERINFIWEKLKFTQKVTARNLFRYKKKFLMTIIGVAGCTALIVAGFAIRDSVGQMIPSQYGEIFKYHGTISLNEDLTTSKITETKDKIKEKQNIESLITCYMKTVEITSIENTQTINLVVANSEENLSDFIELKNKNGKCILDTQNVIITEKIADLLNIDVGDKITIKNLDNVEKDVTVGAITNNYIFHYIYMSSDLYNSLYGENSYKPNQILFKEIQTTQDVEDKLGKELLQEQDIVTGVTFLTNTKDIFSEVMEKMKLVVYILIIAAALLAFAVLYNLSNVNISERIRELATLKVLGFYNNEVFNYITKETRILTSIGIAFGLFGGYFLGMYIIKTCELDMFMFIKTVKPISFVYGFIITIIFAEIVNLAVKRTLKKISMTDSLKSVD